MGKLQAVSPCAGLLPLRIGALAVEEIDAGPITSVTPFEGASKAALERALGMAFPAPLHTSQNGSVRCVWAAQGEALLMGAVPDAGLGAYAAVVDQSDAWAVVRLLGADGAEALARLVPVDMRLHVFPVGATVRSQLGHMNASITRTGEEEIMIAVFRSMAATLVHDLTSALEAVAARR
ncbi:sarcosine oxidase subunit gamma [uncultured Sulfitobacter sp.]|uniref:sarcosine oxidase subunit gamma n=1 Tax=uncultured Sulfitobacter sp. TaxID=191468 RepID=UPI002604F39F|nr:sarcosine oxidase subunit gamma family protein [uncultured Sulfitobacter sp.]